MSFIIYWQIYLVHPVHRENNCSINPVRYSTHIDIDNIFIIYCNDMSSSSVIHTIYTTHYTTTLLTCVINNYMVDHIFYCTPRTPPVSYLRFIHTNNLLCRLGFQCFWACSSAPRYPMLFALLQRIQAELLRCKELQILQWTARLHTLAQFAGSDVPKLSQASLCIYHQSKL